MFGTISFPLNQELGYETALATLLQALGQQGLDLVLLGVVDDEWRRVGVGVSVPVGVWS